MPRDLLEIVTRNALMVIVNNLLSFSKLYLNIPFTAAVSLYAVRRNTVILFISMTLMLISMIIYLIFLQIYPKALCLSGFITQAVFFLFQSTQTKGLKPPSHLFYTNKWYFIAVCVFLCWQFSLFRFETFRCFISTLLLATCMSITNMTRYILSETT